MITFVALQMQQIEIAGQKAAQELAAAKKQYLQKIVSWQLPESKAKDVVFMVHAQLRRKQKRVQAFYVCPASASKTCARRLLKSLHQCKLTGDHDSAGQEKQSRSG